MGQNREPRNKPMHGFNKEAKNMQWIKNSVFNKWCWENSIFTYKRIKLDPYTVHRKLSQNGLKKSVKAKTEKSLEKNIGIKLFDIDLDNKSLYMTSKAQATKQK